MLTDVTPILVEKEHISTLSFPSEPLDLPKSKIDELKHKLNRHMILGNLYHSKCRIVFKDNESIKEVRTTIWAVGDKNIVLKRGVVIPLGRIIDIK